ncbi:MAG: MFS transporter [Acetobacteraceae bacterium]|nr:MFS transporter [Acetobacteraceae bacterium]
METSERLPIAVSVGALLIVAATYVVNAMDRMVFATLLPKVADEYGFSLTASGFLATVFTLGLGIAAIPAGYLLDRGSRNAVAAIGIVVYSIGTVLTARSVGFYDMAAYRVMAGAGEAIQNAAIFSMAGAYFAGSRTLAFGVLNVAYGIGSLVGPRWGAHLLAESGSWRLPLYVYGVVGLVGALATSLLVPARFADWRTDRIAVGVDPEHHIPGRLLNRNTVLVSLAAIGGGVAGYGYLGLYPTFLRTELAFSVQAAGAAASMYGAGALTGLLGGYLADRVNQKWLTILALIALGLVGYALFDVATTPLWQCFLSFLEGAALSGFLYLNNYSLMQRSVRSAMTGRASGLVVACVYLSGAVSGYLFASLVGWVGWGRAALMQMSLFLAVPIVAMLLFDVAATSSKSGHGCGTKRRRTRMRDAA